MPSRRWVNRHQPQTLVLATVLLYMEGLFNLDDGKVLLALVVPVALFALLVHPHSRGHQRIWFE